MTTSSPADLPASIQLAHFAGALFAADDIVELRVLPIPDQRWVRGEDLASREPVEWLAQQSAAGQNLYVGANPRTEVGGADAAHVAFARSLFVDFDGGVTPVQALDKVQAAGLPPPSVVVFSGHGTHCYWLLDKPMTDLAAWTLRQKALIAQLHTDKVINDPPRIMRLPGFLNTKTAPAVMSVLVACQRERLYGLQLFPSSTPRPPRPHSSAMVGLSPPRGIDGLSRRTRRFLAYGAGEGERNRELFAAACDLAGCGVSERDAELVLLSAATRCRPPYSEQEARGSVRSAYSKARSPARRPPVGWGSFAVPMLPVNPEAAR